MLQRLDGERIQGLVVLVIDDEEVTLVNLVGEIDPESTPDRAVAGRFRV